MSRPPSIPAAAPLGQRIADAPSVDEVLDLLRRRGGRVTASRRAILEVLLSGDEHFTAEQLMEAVQARLADVHPSTFYRTLTSLEEAGVIGHAHLGHGPACWHVAGDDRHHLVCERCGAVEHVPDAAFDALRAELTDRHGFVVTLRHFAFTGLCRECAGAR